jgi:prepilin-type N-terminal cleavage/methylation domain-containing protein
MATKKVSFNSKGFTLIEVMIALAIFGVFIVSYMAATGYNVADSSQIRNEIQLRNFAEIKMNELIYKPPEYKESLTLKPEEGTFEINENFKWIVEYKRFVAPDLNKILGTNSEKAKDANSEIQQKIYEKVKENLKEMLWQVKVTVKNLNTQGEYSVSTWIINEKAPVKLETL